MTIGRPKRNPIEAIKTPAFMGYVCHLAQISYTGYQLESYFEPERIQIKDDGTRIRSGKWDRFIAGTHTPSKTARDTIYSKLGHKDALEMYFNHPIWVALAAGEFDSQYWMNFYQTLPIDIQKLIFKKNNTSGQPLVLKTIRLPTIKSILKFWNDDAFACLVALSRDSSVNIDFFAKRELPFFVHKYLQYLFEMSFFSRVTKELWEHFQHYIIPNSILSLSHHDLWTENDCYHKTMTYSRAMGVNYLKAEDVCIINSKRSGNLFLYWKLFGNLKLINQELNEAFHSKNYRLPDSNKGLKWLIKQMNKHLPKSEHINATKIL
ncbi:hypothetical protein A6F57_04885 [Alteromonas stellipolaris]|uniref:hypothetical protein n=1 Tax=Alteromonas stellipolaris TaxID=233316 RepID=UPI0007B44960|nr:hypothetical protein [Alteromonas stellipolaris]ANB24602.1 hypothetical protein A6F57_04885 [Alteromonas stellipolaris]